jgi:hypothetical protein
MKVAARLGFIFVLLLSACKATESPDSMSDNDFANIAIYFRSGSTPVQFIKQLSEDEAMFIVDSYAEITAYAEPELIEHIATVADYWPMIAGIDAPDNWIIAYLEWDRERDSYKIHDYSANFMGFFVRGTDYNVCRFQNVYHHPTKQYLILPCNNGVYEDLWDNADMNTVVHLRYKHDGVSIRLLEYKMMPL